MFRVDPYPEEISSAEASRSFSFLKGFPSPQPLSPRRGAIRGREECAQAFVVRTITSLRFSTSCCSSVPRPGPVIG